MKWSIIRVGIVAMFMGMATIVLGMTDDDREQRRAAVSYTHLTLPTNSRV